MTALPTAHFPTLVNVFAVALATREELKREPEIRNTPTPLPMDLPGELARIQSVAPLVPIEL